MEVVEQYLDLGKEYLEIAKTYLPQDEKEIEWWIKFRNPHVILQKHESYLFCEVMFYVAGFLTFCHAMKSGGRYRWLWLSTVAHGLTVECVSYWLPDIDSFWHAQSMVMLLGQRLPLHILLVYPVFIYVAVVAVAHMNLRWWAEPFAVGLTVVLLDIPFDIMGVKMLWWTWHDDDPNIFDRHYWVPWTSYYFHASFASSFTFLFFGLRSLMCSSGLKFQSPGFFLEIPMLIVTGLFSMPFGILQFIPVYHPLHDSLGIHSEVCVLLLLGAYALIVWSADRYPYESARISNTGLLNLIPLTVILHYSFYIYMVFMGNPKSVRSLGYHQPVGPCESPMNVLTPFGQVLTKNKYLCLDKFDEGYFNLKCLKKQPADETEWYTVCGTAYDNHAEYRIVVTAFCALGLFWFWQTLFRSGAQPRTRSARPKQHRD